MRLPALTAAASGLSVPVTATSATRSSIER
jgi:hypothetical protein